MVSKEKIRRKTKGVFKYRICQKAGKVAISLGATNKETYKLIRENDPHLPADPQAYYPDFPGWKKFLETEKYPTWQQASIAAIKIGATTERSYKKLYFLDKKLPRNPEIYYKNFPGMYVFLGTKKRQTIIKKKKEKKLRVEVKGEKKESKCYPSWKESIWACLKIGGIYDLISYRQLRHKDPRLMEKPQLFYSDFKWGDMMFYLSPEEKEYFRKKDEKELIRFGELEEAV